MAVNTQSQSACPGRPPRAHLAEDGKEVGVRSVFLSDDFLFLRERVHLVVRSRAEIAASGHSPPTRRVPAATHPCRGRSGARPPQMGAIRRPPAWWKLPEVGRGLPPPPFIFPPLPFRTPGFAHSHFITFFSSKTLSNLCKYVQTSTSLCACTRAPRPCSLTSSLLLDSPGPPSRAEATRARG